MAGALEAGAGGASVGGAGVAGVAVVGDCAGAEAEATVATGEGDAVASGEGCGSATPPGVPTTTSGSLLSGDCTSRCHTIPARPRIIKSALTATASIHRRARRGSWGVRMDAL